MEQLELTVHPRLGSGTEANGLEMRLSRWGSKPYPKYYVLCLEDIWLLVKTLVPSEPQNSWDLWMFIPLKMFISSSLVPRDVNKALP